ncbi:hypothetical protein RB653_009960 [Dictyostelium firmibasis]|uniref:EGF-like domain-containing protein n=1 Tax=Dictyostelium firmibasis TaxID=79012 RepID=A0AAN7TS49_9MYCE
MNKKKLFFFLIFQFFFYYSLSTVQYTINTDDLIQYPSSQLRTTCFFSVKVLITNFDQKITSVQIPNFSALSYSSSDGKSSFLSLSASNVEFGNYTTKISFLNATSTLYSIDFNYYCNRFDFENYKIIGLSSSFTLNNVFFLFKITNFPPKVLLEGITSNNGRVIASRALANGLFFLQIDKIKSLSIPINTSFNFDGGKTLSFTIDLPFQIDTYTEIESLEYYPKSNIILTDNIVSYGNLKLKTNSSYIYFDSNSNILPIKTGGNNIDESLYMLQFIGLSSYSFRIQNGSSFIEKQVSLYPGSFTNTIIITGVGIFSFYDRYQYITLEGIEIKNITLLDDMKITSPLSFLRKSIYFPFGYIGGNSKQSNFSFSFVFFQTNPESYFVVNYDSVQFNPYSFNGSLDINSPRLLGYEIIASNYESLIFKLRVSDDSSGIKYIQTAFFSYAIFGDSFVDGNSLNATLEFKIPYAGFDSINLCDNAMNCEFYNLDSYYFLDFSNPVYLTSPSTLFSIPKEFDLSNCIQDISYKYNDFSVTDISIANVMYIDIINFPTSRDLTISLILNSANPYAQSPTYFATYNNATKKFECEFIVPANINVGPLQFLISFTENIIFSFSLPKRFQLIVKESLYTDFIGPIVTKYSKFQNGSNPLALGWDFIFENDINGYKDGYILVRSSIDMAIRNITGIRSSGTIFNGTYKFSATVSQTCISQTYTIFYAKFIDTQGQETIYDKMNPGISSINPFYPLLNDVGFTSIDLICKSSLLSPNGPLENPTLNSFTFSPSILEVFSSNRKITFNYTASHPDGLLIYDSIYPIIYLTSHNQEIITGSQSTTILSHNKTHVNYCTQLEVPVGFGYSGTGYNSLIVNCFGIISNAGTHSGYTSKLLNDTNFPFNIEASFTSVNVILTGSSVLSSNGGKLFIYGRFLGSVASITVEHGSNKALHTPKQLSETQFLIDDISPTDTYISITALSGTNLLSNTLIVYPKLFKNSTISKPSIPTPTPSTPTIKCKTTCGESNKQGYCSTTQGVCICYSPWIGNDCQSRIITVPPPKVNETNPSTEITTPSESSELTYSSVVSIVSIREFDYYNNVVNNYTFEKWIFKPIVNTDNKKIYSYFSNIIMNNQVVSNITSVLEWNSKASIVQFAGQNISLNPSSIKYTITISKYNFESQLNTLQLIMSASIKTQNDQTNDKCSSINFGDSSSSTNQNNIDSNYIQLQVDDHSFYGRFIKRCLLDSRVVSISNSLLDGNLSALKSNKASSFVGINIPWFSKEAILDPDFSVLLGQPDNSCNGANDSGLTKSQLIGIIVGSVCFFIVLVIILLFFLLKRCLLFKIFVYKLFKKRKY